MHRTQRPSNVEIRADDPALTGHAGLLLTGELAARTDLVARLDRAIDGVRPFKQRRRGSSAGELLVALAEMMAVGGDHLVHLDELREDEAGAELRAVDEVLAPTTAGQLMRRLKARQCQAAVAELAKVGEEVDCRLGLTTTAPVTLDLDCVMLSKGQPTGGCESHPGKSPGEPGSQPPASGENRAAKRGEAKRSEAAGRSERKRVLPRRNPAP